MAKKVRLFALIFTATFIARACNSANAQLSANFYDHSCPNLVTIVADAMRREVNAETRMAASILRMHFHDCFVQGCDASILLDDTATFTGEKTAGPNVNSVRGYEIVDRIKNLVNQACGSLTVSCADILTLATREGIRAVGGPSWRIALGRRDSTTASIADANSQIPGPTSPLNTLIPAFRAKGLSARDMTALSGGHTIGFSRCLFFRSRIYGSTNIDPAYAARMQALCPQTGNDNNLGPLDAVTNSTFDNAYFGALIALRGLLPSDQVLFSNGSQDGLVRAYSANQRMFFDDFAAAMVRMDSINPLTGTAGQIRVNCRMLN